MFYLEQYTSGESKEPVRSSLPNRGYAETNGLLEYHFGDERNLAGAYMAKALNRNDIKAEDRNALTSYAFFLQGCYNLFQDLKDMEGLILPSTLRLLVS